MVKDCASSNEGEDRSVCFSKTFDGPYHQELESALSNHGVSIRWEDGLDLQLLQDAMLGDVDVLHLHFLHQFHCSSSILRKTRDIIFLWAKLIILRTFDVQVVWTIHDYYERNPNLQILTQIANLGVVCLINNVIVHCECAVRLVIREFHVPSTLKDKFSVIPHGNFIRWYPDRYTESEARELLPVDNDSTVFVACGNLHPYKQIPQIIERFTALRQGAELVVVGAGNVSVAKEVRELANNNSRVHFKNTHIDRDEMGKYFKGADFAIYNYSKRLTSGSVMTAVSFGTPVIAADVGCLQSMVSKEDSILFSPEQECGLQHALEKSMRVDMTGEKNRRLAEKRDWNKIAERTVSVYRTQESKNPETGKSSRCCVS